MNQFTADSLVELLDRKYQFVIKTQARQLRAGPKVVYRVLDE